MEEFEQLIRDLYGKYSPDTDVDEKIQKFSQAGLSPQEFLDGFYKKHDPTKGTDDRKNNIIKTYFSKQLKENEDKELKEKGQVRSEDVSALEVAGRELISLPRRFVGGVADVIGKVKLDAPLAINQGISRAIMQAKIYQETGELRRLKPNEVKLAHFITETGFNAISTGLDIGPLTGSKKAVEEKNKIIDDLYLAPVVYDDQLSEQALDTFSDTFDKGLSDNVSDYVKLGFRTIGTVGQALPTTLAAMHPVGRGALFVGSTASKLNEEYEQNPELKSEVLFLNALGHGGIELADAYLSSKILGGGGVLWGSGASKAAVKEYFAGSAMRIFKPLNMGLEALTEMSQSTANELWDGVVLGSLGGSEEDRTIVDWGTNANKNFWRKKQWEIYDEGIIGGITALGFSSVRAMASSDAKRFERMKSMLTPISVKKQQNENLKRLTDLQQKLDNTTDPNSRKIIQDAMKVLGNKISKTSNEAQQVVENLSESQLKEYAKNVDKINRNLNKIDNKTTPEAKTIIEEQNKELSDINEKMFNEVKEANFGENVRFAKTEGAKLGLDVNVVNSKKSFDDKVKALTGQNIKNESGIEGVFIGGGQILINKETALKQGAISVGSHEVLHPVLNALIGNEAKQKKIVEEFKKELTSKQRKYMDKAMKLKTAKEQYTEYLTVFSDGLRLKKMDYSLTNAESFMKLGKSISNAFKNVGFTNASFKDGKGVYEFMKEYNKSISEGGLTEAASKAIKDAEAKVKVKIKDVKALNKKGQFSRTETSADGLRVNEIYEKTANKTEAGFLIATEYTGQAFSIFESLKQASNYTQDQKNTLENNKEDIISMILYDQIPDKKQDSKLRNVVGLVQDFKKEKQKYKNLSAYINTFLRERSKEVFKYYVKDAVVESMNDSEGNVKTSVAKKSNTESNTDQGPETRALTDFNDLMINNENFVTSDIYKSIKGEIIKNVTLLLSKGNLDVNGMVDIVNKEISNVIKKAQGKISNTKGKLEISKEYDNFVREGYEGGIKSLPIRVIKDSYLNKLFPTRKLGKVDMQNRKDNNPDLKKDSNYRIDKLEIKKPTIGNWVKYFTEGGYTTLLAKQKKYATEIAKAISLKVTRESILDQNVLLEIFNKSSLRNEEITLDIIKTYFNTFEQTLDTKLEENSGFDNIQFSQNNQITEASAKLLAGKFKNDDLSGISENVIIKLYEPIKNAFKGGYISTVFQSENLSDKDLQLFESVKPLYSVVKDEKILNENTNKLLNKGFGDFLKQLPSELIEKFETVLDFAGMHHRGKNLSADEAKAFIKKLPKNVVETDPELLKLYEKINFEHVSLQLQGQKWYNDNVLAIQAGKNLKEKISLMLSLYKDIVLMNKANLDLKNYLDFKMTNLAKNKKLSKEYLYIRGRLETNIAKSGRALSMFNYIELLDGAQVVLNRNGGLQNKPTKGKKTTDEVYKKKLDEYYDKWKQTVTWSEALEIAKKIQSNDKNKNKTFTKNQLFDLTIKQIVNKNEHLKENSMTAGLSTISAMSGKFDATINNTHITAWLSKMTADKMDAAGGTVTFDGISRLIKYLSSEVLNNIYHISGLSARTHVIQTTVNKGLKDGTIKMSELPKDVQNEVSIQKSQSNSDQFNKIIQDTKGVDAVKIFSNAAAKSRGAKKGLYDFFIPPTAEDFVGLLYKFIGKGKVGEAHMEFFKQKLTKPFNAAMAEMDRRKQRMSDEYKALGKKMPSIKKLLNENTGYNEFTFDSAVRVYLWTKAGFSIPGLSKRDQIELVKKVKENSDLKLYADSLGAISNVKDGWVKPTDSWLGGNIPTDLNDISQKVSRKELLAEWIKNKNEIFNKDNLNKIEATYGTEFRESLEEILGRMERGSNRPIGSAQNKMATRFMNWVNNSVGAIMFVNVRTAVLQTISMANFVNFQDNNLFAAAKAFANQKQFWSDFTMLFNSDFLKQRRSGLKTDINEAELSNAVGTATNKAQAAFKYMLKKGFLPTQFADSFAIAMGGASFVRNRVNSLIKSGMTKQEAMDQAMLDFREISEEAQQSSRPDRISSQQAGPLGRVILAFANTPMQYARLQKKAILDLKNGRGDWKSNVSKILYYGIVQNFIFNALQQALFAMAFDDDEETLNEKQIGIMNGMADSLLRGTGVAGAGVATVKNMVMELIRQNKKDRPDYVNVALKSTTISPPISSKLSKLVSAARTFQWNGEEIRKEGLSLDNPANLAVGKTVSAFTNIPLDRLVKKIDNLKTATEEETAAWQSIALTLGWDQWSLGLDPYQKKNKKDTKLKKGQVKLRGKSVKLRSKTVKLRK